jgi:hypothetical protein
MLTSEQSLKLHAWRKARADLAACKEIEGNLRKEAAELCFPSAKVGTNSLELGQGYVAKMVKKETFKFVVPSEYPDTIPGTDTPYTVEAALGDLAELMRQTSNEGPFIYQRLVKVSYEPSVTEYKALSPAMRKVVDPFIETKFGAPALDIIEPKAKEA